MPGGVAVLGLATMETAPTHNVGVPIDGNPLVTSPEAGKYQFPKPALYFNAVPGVNSIHHGSIGPTRLGAHSEGWGYTAPTLLPAQS